MECINQMQERILAALKVVVDERDLDWVEISTEPSHGIVRLQQPGEFRTLLKLEYEFQPRTFRLLVYLDGRQTAGRCGIDYDDGSTIEELLSQFRQLVPQERPRDSRMQRREPRLWRSVVMAATP